MEKTNLSIRVNVGLQNDWGIFNLSGVENSINAYTNIYVEVITDGSKYVDNTDATFRHAATSPYRELQSILPVVSNEEGQVVWDIPKGKKLKQVLNGYYPVETPADESDLWEGVDNYKKYVNTFEVTFEPDTGTYGETVPDRYYNYRSTPVLFSGKKYIKKTLNDVVGNNCIQANVDLLHFSKYYNIYTYSPNPIPTLRPLVYDVESLSKYGMTLDRNNRVYLNNLLMMRMNADDSWEEIGFAHTIYREDQGCYSTDYEVNHWANGRYISNGSTMFRSTPATGSPFVLEGEEESFKKFMPEGFSLMGMWNNCEDGIILGPEENPYTYNGKTLPTTYTSIFDTTGGTVKYNFYGLEDNSQSKVRLTFIYYGDQQDNFRIFNDYFYVRANRKNIFQDICYNSSRSGKMPRTLGIALTSVLVNLYVYSSQAAEASDIPYISDCVFLNPNQTLYTKDIVYKAYVSKNTDNTDLLIFRGYKFRDYIDKVKQMSRLERVKVNSDDTYNSSDKNITPNIDGCIKNIPLQLNINYLEPNIESVGASDSITRVFRIDGTHKDVYGWVPEDSKLYQLDITDDGQYKINTLGKSFTINYIKEPFTVNDDGTFTAEFDENVTPEPNTFLYNMFGYDGETLTFKKTKATEGISKYYGIEARTDPSAWYESQYYTYVTLKYVPRQDVLIPHAKLM